MQISNASGSSVAAAVWAAATRSLTVDPATDAGAATLVWTHAARSLTVDPATDAGAATLVWTHATRTITSDPGAAFSTEFLGTSVTTSAVQGSLGTYVQVVASTAHSVRWINVQLELALAIQENLHLVISTGGAGSEVQKFQVPFVTQNSATGYSNTFHLPVDQSVIPKGVRVAIAGVNDSSANARAFNVAITLGEFND